MKDKLTRRIELGRENEIAYVNARPCNRSIVKYFNEMAKWPSNTKNLEILLSALFHNYEKTFDWLTENGASPELLKVLNSTPAGMFHPGEGDDDGRS